MHQRGGASRNRGPIINVSGGGQAETGDQLLMYQGGGASRNRGPIINVSGGGGKQKQRTNY